MRLTLGLNLLALLVPLACRANHAESASHARNQSSCEEQQHSLIQLLDRLPERALTASVQIQLPEAQLLGSIGSGSVLELSAEALRLDGKELPGATTEERLIALETALTAWLSETGAASNGKSEPESAAPTLYLATHPETNVRTLRQYLTAVPKAVSLRLLFSAPAVPLASEAEASGHQLAGRLLAEQDPQRRKQLAAQGYRDFASCSHIATAARSADSVEYSERWPKLRSSMLQAIGQCNCETLDAGSLKHLLVAEQRAGSMAFGALPLDFMRDERCGASMPLRSVQKLLRQVEQFDAEFAGAWQQGELSFTKVIVNERLLNYFCDALPGETLAALQRARGRLFWRVATDDACQAWEFVPLSPGAPMGTWWRVRAFKEQPALAFHYWQGAEEIRIFGPTQPDTQATDERKFACDQNVRMVAVDESSITLEQGRWFFSQAACDAAPASAATVPGCVGVLASGSVGKQQGDPEPAERER